MSRGMMFLIILVLLIAGGAYLLASGVKEQPTRQIEVDVASNAAAS